VDISISSHSDSIFVAALFSWRHEKGEGLIFKLMASPEHQTICTILPIEAPLSLELKGGRRDLEISKVFFHCIQSPILPAESCP
jgi:hypothetical protein